LRDHFGVSVSFQKSRRERQPLTSRQCSNQIEQKNEQVVRLSRRSGQRFLVVNFEIDQPRAIVARFINHVRNAGIAVRPASAKFVTPKFMSATKFGRRRQQHSPRERAAIQMLPQTFARKFVCDHCSRAGGGSTKTVPV